MSEAGLYFEATIGDSPIEPNPRHNRPLDGVAVDTMVWLYSLEYGARDRKDGSAYFSPIRFRCPSGAQTPQLWAAVMNGENISGRVHVFGFNINGGMEKTGEVIIENASASAIHTISESSIDSTIAMYDVVELVFDKMEITDILNGKTVSWDGSL